MNHSGWLSHVLCPLLSDNPAGETFPEGARATVLAADVDKIQAYVFESDKLPEIRGASRQITGLNTSAIYAALDKQGLPSDCVLYAQGGSVLALLPPDGALADAVPGELKLRVVRGYYRSGDALYYLPHGTLTGDLSSYKPASEDDAVILMVCLDTVSQALSYVAGDAFTVDRSKTVEDAAILDVWANAPAEIPAGCIPLGCALLTGRASMTEFLDKHIQAHVAVEAAFSIWDAVYGLMGAGDGDVDEVVQLGGLVALAFFTSSDANAWTPATASFTVPAGKVAAVVEVRGSGEVITDETNRRVRLYNVTDSAEVVGYEDFAASGFPWSGTAPAAFPEAAAGKEVRLEVWNSDATERAMGGAAILRVREV